MHFSGLFLLLPWHLCLIPQHFIYTDLGPVFHYFSTFFIAPSNWRLLAISNFASVLLLTVMTIAKPRLFLLFCYSLKPFLLTSQHGIVFKTMTIKNSTSLFKNFIFPSPRYWSNDILCTFRPYNYSSTSIPITALSITFITLINILDH